jgi:hypothetical protein
MGYETSDPLGRGFFKQPNSAFLLFFFVFFFFFLFSFFFFFFFLFFSFPSLLVSLSDPVLAASQSTPETQIRAMHIQVGTVDATDPPDTVRLINPLHGIQVSHSVFLNVARRFFSSFFFLFFSFSFSFRLGCKEGRRLRLGGGRRIWTTVAVADIRDSPLM